MARKPTGLYHHAPISTTRNTANDPAAPDGEYTLLEEVRSLREMLALLREQARRTEDADALLRLAGAMARISDAIVRALNAQRKCAPTAEPLALPSPRQAEAPTEPAPRPRLSLMSAAPRTSALSALLDEVDRLIPPTTPADADPRLPHLAEPLVTTDIPAPTPATPRRPSQPPRPTRARRSRRGKR
jgi:hypothetical protein